MKKLWMTLSILFALAVPLIPVANADSGRPSCNICGMYIDQFRDTSTQLTLKDGEKLETCGVACMLRYINDKGGPDAFSSLMVHDWNKKILVPAAGAIYVIGSKKIPDMTPNIIAFESKEDAEAFREKEGGEILSFDQALLSISPMMMTMPTRIKTAVLSPQGAVGVGVGYMHMAMDKVKLGTDSVDPREFSARPGQMMGPKEMTTDAEMLMISYGVTDDLSLGITEAYFDKKMESYKLGGSVIETTKSHGLGDLDVTFRYNLWKNTYYDKFLTLLAGATLPTGEFKTEFITMPGLQIGAGAFSFTGGMLFSNRYKNLWFHYMASYTIQLENGDDYKFGDTTRLGAAVHYTPNYSFMTGLEMDGAYAAKDRYRSNDIDNTGGYRSNLTAVAEWKFLTALGGTFSMRAYAGLPIYEDLNHYKVGLSEKAKIGGGWFAGTMINFSRRPLW
jgi:nitrous oxide reductase accessory protein NosL